MVSEFRGVVKMKVAGYSVLLAGSAKIKARSPGSIRISTFGIILSLKT
jgi:hypothetical protein